MIDVKLLVFHSNKLKHLTVCKKQMNSGSFKKVIHKPYIHKSYIFNMYKEDLALNNQQWLICHKTQ